MTHWYEGFSIDALIGGFSFYWRIDRKVFFIDTLIGGFSFYWHVDRKVFFIDALIGGFSFYWRIDRKVFFIDALIGEYFLLTRWYVTWICWRVDIGLSIDVRWNEIRFCWRADMRVFSVDTLITYRRIFLSEARFDTLQYTLGIAKKIFCNKNL